MVAASAALFTTGAAAAAAAARAPALPPLPSKAAILADGQRAARYWLNLTNSKQQCNWEDSTFMLGLMALQNATGDAALLQTAVDWGDRHGWRFCAGRDADADFQLCGAVYAQAYVAAGRKNATWLAGAISQYEKEMADKSAVSSWSWVDALFMTMSVYARLGAITGDRRYYQHMYKNFDYGTRTGYKFWSGKDSLFYRDPLTAPPAPWFWSRGNGWAMGALVAAIQHSPASDARRAVYVDMFQKHAARLAQLQGRDGCWRVSLADPEFYDLPEATGTSMFAYGIAYGVDAGLLARGAYLPVVERAWQCLSRFALQPSGRVGYCQPVGVGVRRNFDPNTTQHFCVGQFLLAASAVSKLAA